MKSKPYKIFSSIDMFKVNLRSDSGELGKLVFENITLQKTRRILKIIS